MRGADLLLYPPMKTLLDEARIDPLVGYDLLHLDPAAGAIRPDLVIVGNTLRPQSRGRDRGAAGPARLSMPEALWRFFLAARRPLVMAGTHGKTTTTAQTSSVLLRAGRDPGLRIGGLAENFERSFQVGAGDRCVVEGDDLRHLLVRPRSGMVHCRLGDLILNSVEYDHADLYPSHGAAGGLPPTGGDGDRPAASGRLRRRQATA